MTTASLLGLNEVSDEDAVKIEKIEEFLKEEDKEKAVRELDNKLGPTSLGERRIDKVYRYVKLQSLV